MPVAAAMPMLADAAVAVPADAIDAIDRVIAPLTGPVLRAADIAGTAVFAASGALMAARARQTLVTFCFFALVTGTGGGTVRDLLIGAPVFWVRDGWIAALCIGVALMVWVTPERWWRGALLEWFDAAGLAAFAVFGTAKAMAFGVGPVPAVLMGIITGCVGGIIRDMLAGRPSIIIRPELYVTAAALAAGGYVALRYAGVPANLAAAIRWQLGLPAYRGGGRA